jgi:hypothetical protein
MLESNGMMAERRREMERKKFGAVLGALAAGFVLSASSPAQAAFDAVSGYLQGDPSPGKLIPYWAAEGDLATIIGIENTSGQSGPTVGSTSEGDAADVAIHVTVFNHRSSHLFDDTLCLSPFDFGYIILQKPSPSNKQLDDLRAGKSIILSRDDGDLGSADHGYVSLKALAKFSSTNGSCKSDSDTVDYDSLNAPAEPLAVWTIVQDVGAGFFGTEVPVATALVDDSSGKVTGGLGAFGLIPGPTSITADPSGLACSDSGDGSTVIARFDVNPNVGSETSIFVWLRRNLFNVSGDPAAGCNRNAATLIGFLDCETEKEISTTVSLPDEVNVINPADLNGIAQCSRNGLFRGVLRFEMPDTGFLWSHITQEDAHFRMNFLGYNLDCNTFLSEWFSSGNCSGLNHSTGNQGFD